MWHEAIAGRGSDEIATCIYDYIASLPSTVTDVHLFSDTCGGQNRNIQMSTALMRACQMIPNIERITQYMMESGHSQMECDSVHSTIERAIKKVPIYSPLDYYATVRVARHNKPYEVKVMETTEFKNMKSVVNAYVRNRTKCTDGSIANWMKAKTLKYQKAMPGIIELSYNYDEPTHFLAVTESVSRRSQRSLMSDASMPDELCPLFNKPPSISKLKYDDLQSLCESMVIPRVYHQFYKSLTSDASIQIERLPQPDMNEDCDVME
jgi:hypothetical protein